MYFTINALLISIRQQNYLTEKFLPLNYYAALKISDPGR